MAQTTRFTRRNLPHWEVEAGRYFVTVRCADSLPCSAVVRLAELHASGASIEPRSADFTAWQRQLFRSLEKYLDAGNGCCPLRGGRAARIVIDEFAALGELHVAIPHFTIMPNHWHALLVPSAQCVHPLSAILKRIKGRTARNLRRLHGGAGAIWQREWFDHWIRTEAEWERCVAYIRNNPVKAGLVAEWPDHAWTK